MARAQRNLLMLLGLATLATVSLAASHCSQNKPCANGGTCSSGLCLCPSGFTGLRCQVSPTQPTCSPVACQLFCAHGFKKDANGCQICACAAPPTTKSPVTTPAKPTCTPVACQIFCAHGFKKDTNGCQICACAAPPTTKSPVTTPASTKPGVCPTFKPASSVCHSTCTKDSQCSGTKKCCMSSCQGKRCTCPAVTCKLLCPFGYLKGKDGCNICSCASPKTTQAPQPTTAAVTTKRLTLCQRTQKQVGTPPPRRGKRAAKPVGSYYPTCDNEDGFFEAIQCPPSGPVSKLSDCFCVDVATGVPSPNTKVVLVGGEKMCVAVTTATMKMTATTKIPVPTTASAGCRLKNGTVIKVGVSYKPNACTHCTCFTSGHAPACASSSCPHVTCATGSKLMHHTGVCCPTCVKIATTATPVVTTTKVQCGPVCGKFCPHGHMKDARGCPTCICNPAPTTASTTTAPTTVPTTTIPATTSTASTCPPIRCRIRCQHGYKKGENGCPICQCNPAPTKAPTTAPTTVPITTASGCRLANGTVVAVGVSFQQGPCKRCVCHSSGVAASCFVIDCPRPPTCMTGYRLTTRPGACCPSCTAIPTTKPGTKPTTTPCPHRPCPLCPNGYVYRNGCQTCTCKPAPTTTLTPTKSTPTACPRPRCLPCPGGYVFTSAGCQTCRCKPVTTTTKPTPCPIITCLVPCPKGYVYRNGCQTCTCRSTNTTISTATTKSTPTACPRPRCLPCPGGYVFTSAGCQTCRCKPVTTTTKPTPCPIITCLVPCPKGYVYRNGCQTCTCRSTNTTISTATTKSTPTACPRPRCLPCPGGYVFTSAGCQTCRCKPVTTTTKPTPCPIITCLVPCPKGYVYRNGCQTCTCRSTNTTISTATTKPGPTACPRLRCVACPGGYVVTAAGCQTCQCLPTKTSAKPMTTGTPEAPILRIRVQFELTGAEGTMSMLKNTTFRSQFTLYLAEWLQRKYSLARGNLMDLFVSQTAAKRALVTFDLMTDIVIDEAAIRQKKSMIEEDAQASKYTIRYPYGGKTLEMSLAAVDSGDNSGDGSGQTDTSSSGLSTITVVAISVGAGIALTAIIVMLIVLVKSRTRRAAVPYVQEDGYTNATYTTKHSGLSINSNSPNFDEPLYDTDTRNLVE